MSVPIREVWPGPCQPPVPVSAAEGPQFILTTSGLSAGGPHWVGAVVFDSMGLMQSTSASYRFTQSAGGEGHGFLGATFTQHPRTAGDNCVEPSGSVLSPEFGITIVWAIFSTFWERKQAE